MGKGYAEGSAVEERLAALERGDDLHLQLDAGRTAVYGSTDDDPETHFIGWLGEVDPDEMNHVFNMGLGLVLIVSPYYAESVRSQLADGGYENWLIGKVTSGERGVVWA